jgi:hypothetical protein
VLGQVGVNGRALKEVPLGAPQRSQNYRHAYFERVVVNALKQERCAEAEYCAEAERCDEAEYCNEAERCAEAENVGVRFAHPNLHLH